ncbi:DNA polymerase III subunit alpha [Ectothiorhodospira haloalkaliphila]|uniref:DNA polymerase III subunit alpha n=1 Tax=Ectothiorhodospira haloalkaliphila TaxID=421628 RepID=W8L477_9GAMM|nr:DNA polymerase III subunit alpha [Ectothiorhodospira haloalkaliphila]AHK78705.1 DNA polymerase III subunit alpha [Ectothiorhodospira haloalkaliphila]
MTPSFVHLHLHSEFSLVDGLVRVGALVDTARANGMPACAVTDQNNLFGMVKFYKAALKAGVKPLIGADAWVTAPQPGEPPTRLVLLCQDNEGYGNLTRLISRGYQEGQQSGAPILERDWFTPETCRGLIALSGAREGEVGRALLSSQPDMAPPLCDHWAGLFPGRFYLELVRTGREGEEDYLHAAVELAATRGLPVVATNDVRFLKAEDFDAHEARVCIHDGRVLDDPRRPRLYSRQQYLRTPEEMAELFSDVPEALENTVEIARRCNLTLTLGENYLPQFPIPDGMTTDEYFRSESRKGLEQRLVRLVAEDDPDREARIQTYKDRLEVELDVICQMGFPGYFLIVADFIQWAKDNGVPVGPGRGSGAGSLVAYALKITDLDPIRYELLFERFLNPERVSMPDFDVDFCMEKRDSVIEYVARRYGREKVSQIITYGTMAAKAVVRDVGRVLGHPYGFVDRIAKQIPMEIGMTLDKALEQEEDLRQSYQDDEEVRDLIDLALKLEGVARNAGKHAGGVVIAPTTLTDFSPLFCEPGGQGVVTHFDKDDVEAIGLVKFDFLGLRTLTIIDWAVHNINARRRENGEDLLDINDVSLEDPDTFSLLKRQETTAVFQLESRGMKDLIKRLEPDDFEDIIALVALYRPGPLQSGMVDDYINRKHGRAKVEYPHPALEPILKPTHGVILYQEQVMQIAQVLAGYSLGGADLLRRAMGKKKPEEMAKQREIFQKGAVEQGVEADTATYIFDLMEKFAGYGFNKSHSAAYALLSYQTAWLKCHYPAAFMAAVLSADMDHTDKIVNLIDECRSMNLEVIPPDVNASSYEFTVRDARTIVYGLGAIKGVGESAIQVILDSRNQGGSFSSLDDLCMRADSQKINRRTLEALIRAGALDSIGPNRATLMHTLPQALSRAEQYLRDQSMGQEDLFGDLVAPTPEVTATEQWPEWDEESRLLAEKETLGLYLTGHPIIRYEAELAQITGKRIADLLSDLADSAPGNGGGNGGGNGEGGGYGRGRQREQTVIVAGLVVAIRTRNGNSGRMAFLTLDDRSGRVEVGLFGDDYKRYQSLLVKDRLLVVEGSAGIDEFSGNVRMRCRQIMDLDQAREQFAKRVELSVNGKASPGLLEGLHAHLEPFSEGPCPIYLSYCNDQASARFRLGARWQVRPSEELIHRLRELLGEESVRIVYR